MITVLLVDDSPLALVVLKRMLTGMPGIKVIGTAANGVEGLALIPQLRPHVVCTDLHMPKMDGLAFTREVMSRHPLPILVISVSVHQKADDHNIFELLEAGAIEVFPKPRGGLNSAGAALSRELEEKIRVLSGVIPIRRHTQAQPLPGPPPMRQPPPYPQLPRPISSRSEPQIVVIGASTGGPQALLTILSDLPAGFPVPILCIQHISTGFLQEMVDWLGGHTPLSVSIARPGSFPQPGQIYFPPEETHLVIDSQGRFATHMDHPEELHCPSIDVTMRSVAKHFGKHALGILLTGMGRDGAEGLQQLVEAGGNSIVQDEATSVVFGMPKAAVERGAARHILALGDISPALHRCVLPAPNRSQ